MQTNRDGGLPSSKARCCEITNESHLRKLPARSDRSRKIKIQSYATLLNELTELTGGRSFTAGNLTDLPDIAAKIGTELRDQYVLIYRPSHKAHDVRWRKIKVKLRTPKGLPLLTAKAKTLLRAQPLEAVISGDCLIG